MRGFDVYAIVDPREHGAVARTLRLIALGGPRLAVQLRAKGAGPEVHAAALEALAPDAERCGAALFVSTHVEHADPSAGADFAVLGPIAEVPGKATPLGWSAFRALAEVAPMPVYALGGITSPDDVRAARDHGARGVAALRALSGPDAEAVLTRWLAASGTMRP